MNSWAAHGFNFQLETEFEGDLFGILSEHGDRAHSDIAKPDNADVDSLHINSA